MPQVRGTQILDGSVQRPDLDVSTAGSAVIRKVVASADIALVSTGVDSGTGDVTPTLSTSTATASEAIAAYAFVNLYNNAGVFAMRNANATTYGREANGFVKAAVSSGATGTAYGPGSVNDGLSSLTPGPFWLSTTNGLGTATVPVGTGNVVQLLGTPKSATAMQFTPGTPVTRA